MFYAVTKRRYEDYHGIAALRHQLIAMFSKDTPEFIDLFPPFANPEALEGSKAPYKPSLVRSFELALKNGDISNGLLSSLKPEKLKKSGWNPKEKPKIPDSASEKKGANWKRNKNKKAKR